MKAIAAVVPLLALAGCTHLPLTRATALDPLLAFSDPSRCEQSPVHARLLDEMVVGDANEGFRPGRIAAPQPFAQALGPIFIEKHDNFTVVGTPVRGTLFGLPLVRIEQAFPDGGDPGDISYTFETAVIALERELIARGFPAKAGQTVSMGPPDGYDHVIQLMSDPSYRGRAMFTCGFQ
ncbi:MAG: hypothetical protein M3Q57_05295 [Pseudomonadota bacterium]|nr:hypothetical protein [Pseudomonadota bacterium]